MTELHWTPEQDATLVEMRGAGESHSKIGRAVGKSRAAVSGRVSRLGLPLKPVGARKPKPAKTSPRPRTINAYPIGAAKKRLFYKKLEPVHRADAPPSKGLALVELEPNHCRWPFGDTDYRFCGHDKQDGSSYCPYHTRLSSGGYTQWREAAE